MANEPQGNVSLLPLILVAAVVFFASRGCTPQEPVKPEPPKPDQVEVPVEKLKPTPDQCWDALAKCVESKWIGGTMQQHTDHLVKIVDGLKASGSVADDSRVSEWRAKRIDITDTNRAQIAAKLRGK
jgi:hypothetical protein